MTDLLAEMLALGMEFEWVPGKGTDWREISPILPPAQQARLDELKEEAAGHWDAFCATVELHLWRKDGTIK